jgi:hypothetical protein
MMKELSSVGGLLLMGGIVWAVLHWSGVNIGITPLDWVVGLLTLVWLLVIVTVPWNIYFQARSIVAESEESLKRGIALDEEKLSYTKQWANRALMIAVVLHLATAAGMLYLATAGISFIGYFGAGAAVILTIVRPIARGYEYVRKRLTSINEEILYPREDIVSLKATVEMLKTSVEGLTTKLDTEYEHSWAAEKEREFAGYRSTLETLRRRLDDTVESNKLEHEKIVRDTQNTMLQAVGDAGIVNHVREILRFFKEA